MQIDGSQLGDVTARDVAGNIVSLTVMASEQTLLMRDMLDRVKRLERVNLIESHAVRINALITAGLFLSAVYRYTAGNRRARRT